MGNRQIDGGAGIGCGVKIGTYGDLDIDAVPGADEIEIDIDAAGGTIAGVTPYGVLRAVYRFLELCGCRFYGPGPEWEIVPQAPLAAVRRREVPTFARRAITIEGGASLEFLLQLVDWLPKVGLNGYHLQLKDNDAFFNRWYASAAGGARAKRPEETAAMTRRLREAMAERGVAYWSMGHGWPCEAAGITARAWEPVPSDPAAPVPIRWAQVNGQRALWRGIPIDTNACYSDAENRRRIVTCAADFLGERDDIEVLFVWLADDLNNHCECGGCVGVRPSDWYVLILNELDAELDVRGDQRRVGLLIFCETLWPPVSARLANPSRFLTIFAPMGMSYTHGLEAVQPTANLPEFELNQIGGDESPNDAFAFLDRWRREQCDQDEIILLYDLLATGIDKDLTGMNVARVLQRTLGSVHAAGIVGVSSCQAQRSFFPTAWPMYALATLLWDVNADLDAHRREYFLQVYGSSGGVLEEVLDDLTDAFAPAFVQGRTDRDVAACERCAGTVEELSHRLSSLAAQQTDPQWRMISTYSLFLRGVAELYVRRASGESQSSLLRLWEQVVAQLRSDPQVLRWFDVDWFERTFRLLTIERVAYVSNFAE